MKKKTEDEILKEQAQRRMSKRCNRGGPYFIFYSDYILIMNVKLAMTLSFLVNISDWKADKDGWFKCSTDRIRKALDLTVYAHETLMMGLGNLGLIERSMKGNPARRYIRINHERLDELLKPAIDKRLDMDLDDD